MKILLALSKTSWKIETVNFSCSALFYMKTRFLISQIFCEWEVSTKLQLKLTILLFWTKLPKCNNSGWKGKKSTSHWVSYTGINLDIKFQLKLTILSFWTKLAQKECFQSKTEKLTSNWILHIWISFQSVTKII